jgi:endonuclease YncB( thermonuclease family)
MLALLVLVAVVAVIAIALLKLGHSQPASAGLSPGKLPQFRVQHVIDGDTVVVAHSWGNFRVRLDSIDCPEDGQPWGDTATAGLIKLIGGRRVRLERYGIDIHGRTLATIYVTNRDNGQWLNVNERMVTLGHAWVARMHYAHLPEARRQQLDRLEDWAKSRRVGLWKTPDPTPPWQWRRA